MGTTTQMLTIAGILFACIIFMGIFVMVWKIIFGFALGCVFMYGLDRLFDFNSRKNSG